MKPIRYMRTEPLPSARSTQQERTQAPTAERLLGGGGGEITVSARPSRTPYPQTTPAPPPVAGPVLARLDIAFLRCCLHPVRGPWTLGFEDFLGAHHLDPSTIRWRISDPSFPNSACTQEEAEIRQKPDAPAGGKEDMPKRQRTAQPDGHTAKRGNNETPQRHVYLILDDWERGYSVRKIDVDAFCDCNLQEEAAPEPLPEPPAVRFEGRHGRLWFFGAHGTKILAMPAYGAADFPVYDTETLGITLCAHPDGHKVRRPPVLASVAGTLYMLVESSLAVLSNPPAPNSDENKTWAWTFMPEHLPFEAPYVKSLAVHPDGRTLFVSVKGRTFSLDTKSLEWSCRGNWAMPFIGEAYFDTELDAWVGLCIHEDGFGRVCSCDAVPIATDAECQTMPAWKLGKDQLFYTDRERHLGATLLSMGDSRYCLLECAAHEDQDGEDYAAHRVYHVTTFRLKYDKDGELRITRRMARSYEMIDAHELNEPYKCPVAFWM